MSEKEFKTCNTDTHISLDFPFVRGKRIYRPCSHTYRNTPNKGFSGGSASWVSCASKDSTLEDAASFRK
jgi:hypothetical protein